MSLVVAEIAAGSKLFADPLIRPMRLCPERDPRQGARRQSLKAIVGNLPSRCVIGLIVGFGQGLKLRGAIRNGHFRSRYKFPSR